MRRTLVCLLGLTLAATAHGAPRNSMRDEAAPRLHLPPPEVHPPLPPAPPQAAVRTKPNRKPPPAPTVVAPSGRLARPLAFVVLARAKLPWPTLDASGLPTAALDALRQVQQARDAQESLLRQRQPDPLQVTAAETARGQAVDRAALELKRQPLPPEASFVLGELEVEVALRRYYQDQAAYEESLRVFQECPPPCTPPVEPVHDESAARAAWQAALGSTDPAVRGNARYALGYSAEDRGELTQADTLYKEALPDLPPTLRPEVELRRADLSLQQGDLAESAQRLDAMVPCNYLKIGRMRLVMAFAARDACEDVARQTGAYWSVAMPTPEMDAEIDQALAGCIADPLSGLTAAAAAKLDPTGSARIAESVAPAQDKAPPVVVAREAAVALLRRCLEAVAPDAASRGTLTVKLSGTLAKPTLKGLDRKTARLTGACMSARARKLGSPKGSLVGAPVPLGPRP
jgi:tetratricopeptide (TPR) repeat protein